MPPVKSGRVFPEKPAVLAARCRGKATALGSPAVATQDLSLDDALGDRPASILSSGEPHDAQPTFVPSLHRRRRAGPGRPGDSRRGRAAKIRQAVSHGPDRHGLVGHEHPARSHRRRPIAGRRPVRRRPANAEQRGGRGREAHGGDAEEVRRLPRTARQGKARNRHRRHARSLAPLADDCRRAGRSPRVRRKADLPHDRRRPGDGQRRAGHRPRRPGRDAPPRLAAQRGRARVHPAPGSSARSA